MLYRIDEVDQIKKAAYLLSRKNLLQDVDSTLKTIDANTVELDWKEEWAFNQHHYTAIYKEYTLFINGLPGHFRWEIWSTKKNRCILDGRCRSVADGENIVLRSIEML